MNNHDIQRLLKAAGYYGGKVDGDIGPKSITAINKVLRNNATKLYAGWEQFSLQRRAVMAAQVILEAAGYEVGDLDGYAGMLTKHAFSQWERAEEPWRPDDRFETIQTPGAVRPWGLQKDMERRFGPAAGPQCTAGVVKLPFKMKVAWNLEQTISTFRCHEEVADSATRVLGRVAEAYSAEDITRLGFDIWSGCFANRKKRGGTTLSTHAYGLAIDFDDTRNQLKWDHTRASLASPDCDTRWRLWEEEGWLSLGRARDFDWMHVQAPGL
jgi:hypothetical protein